MKKVAVLLALVAVGCRNPSVGYEEYFSIEEGGAVASPAGEITFDSVLEDTRCSASSECLREQRVAVRLTVEVGGSVHPFELSGLMTPVGTQYGTPPIVELPDGSWLTITDLSLAEPRTATFYLTPQPRM